MWDLISGTQLDEYLERGADIFLVDMRDPASYRRAHIAGAVNIPQNEFKSRIFEFPWNQLIVLYCCHGPNSMRAARYLASMGYQVADVYGGIAMYRGKYLESFVDKSIGG